MPKIERIHIHNFRGATAPFSLTFAKGKNLAMIFGENGTGKTTIVDALDAVGNCSGGSVAMKSSTKLGQHLPSAGKTAADIVVEVAAGGQTWRAALRRNDLVVTPNPPPPIRVLRRTNLQRFIDSQPAKRYEEVRHLIGVEQVAKAEDALKRALDSAKNQFDEAVRVRFTAEEQLRNIWDAEGNPGGSWQAWAAEAAAQETTGLMVRARRLRDMGSAIRDAVQVKDSWMAAETMLRQRREAFAAIEHDVASSPGLAATSALQLVDILGRVRAFLTSGEREDQCPVCEQPIGANDLKAAVETRLSDLRLFDDLAKRRKDAAASVERAQESVERARTSVIKAAETVADVAGRERVGHTQLEYLVGGFAARREMPDEDEDEDELAAAADFIAECAPIEASLREDEEATTRAAGRVNSIRELQTRVEESARATVELERTVQNLECAHTTMRTTRIGYTQTILNEIADDCNRLYAKIHPNEAKAISTIAMNEHVRASLNQAVRFEGFDNVPPQAYFSESHLDTLGFCVWLAFAKRATAAGAGGSETVLVLDDVFSSVDAPHLSRILDLIVEERANFAQVIITTHQRQWREAFRNSHGPGKWADLIELQSWSYQSGIYSYQTTLALDELRNALTVVPFDRQMVASRAGILLEATLDRLTFQYQTQVPRNRENVYELNPLLDSTSRLFKQLEITRPMLDADDQVAVPLTFISIRPGEIVNQLRQTVFIRNQVGAHYNPQGMDIPDGDVREFAALTVALVDALACPVCGQIPSRANGDHYRCSCPADAAVRMIPLKVK